MVCQNYIILQFNIYVFSKAFLEYTPRTILIIFIYIYIFHLTNFLLQINNCQLNNKYQIIYFYCGN